MKRHIPKSLIICLARNERIELSDIRRRIISVRRVLNGLTARRDHILSGIPDHKIHVPKIPETAIVPPKQTSLF